MELIVKVFKEMNDKLKDYLIVAGFAGLLVLLILLVR